MYSCIRGDGAGSLSSFQDGGVGVGAVKEGDGQVCELVKKFRPFIVADGAASEMKLQFSETDEAY